MPWQSEYTHIWPSIWDQFSGASLAPKLGDTTRCYHHDQQLPARVFKQNFSTLKDCDFDYSWVPHPWDPPYIYVFGNQWWPAKKQPTVEYHVPGATTRKFMHYPRAVLHADSAQWQIPADIDTTNLDLSWVPDPGSPPYIYQFATQHQKTGGPVYTVHGASQVKYLAELRVKLVSKATAIYEIDHLDGAAGQIPNTTRRVRYFDNYRDTLLRIARSVDDEHEYIWICNSICDYTNFDFSWHPEQWQAHMLHVFASGSEKFGDTFFMHVPTFVEQAEQKALLEWYDLNFVDISVARRPMPVIHHCSDSHVDVIKKTDWAGPLALFTTTDYVDHTHVTVPLWRTEVKSITPIQAGAQSVIVPRVSVPSIKTQLYDYSYIDTTKQYLTGDPLDIVFISNGEPNAEANFAHLNSVTYKLKHRLHRVDGVNGRVAAYHAAAEVSQTAWFFAVFAKLEVNRAFDWSWQPDRMQPAKHYIFHAQNPVTGLEYGHMAMIAYNKQLTLRNPGVGMDFTLDSPHEVVPILSGYARYNTSAWSTWRTAFREVLKLKASLPDIESEYRLNRWLDSDQFATDYNHWSVLGAEDAVEYYDAVNGNFTELRKSYEWAWLASYVFMKRSLTTDQ